MADTRRDAVEQLADMISLLCATRPARVAIDGIDAAGKTMLADELVEPLGRRSTTVIRASIDGFHRPRAERYRRGDDSPEGYYSDSFDHAALRRELLEPLGIGGNRMFRTAVFDYRRDEPIVQAEQHAGEDAVLLFDGVFLFRPELNDCWDWRIFVQVDFDVALKRAVRRDQELYAQIEARYRRRYQPGQRLYLESVRPEEQADIIVDNNDPEHPVLLRKGAGSRS